MRGDLPDAMDVVPERFGENNPDSGPRHAQRRCTYVQVLKSQNAHTCG